MLKNITLSADAELIAQARSRAQLRNATLNEEFRVWLAQYVQVRAPLGEFRALMDGLAHVKAGRKWTRDEANERQ
jgi:hypothetical protein